MKTRRYPPHTAAGFTLAEVAIATGIAAGVLAILTMMMGALSRDVRRLKPYEAWRRPAFVGKANASSSTGSSSTNNSNNSSSTTDTDTQPNTAPPTPTNTLPDANLDPSKRPAEGSVPPDPDDPANTTPKTDGTGTTNGTSGTTTP